MHPVVTLTTHFSRAATGKRYTHYQLRWFGPDGRRYSENIGRTDELSKRQAEKLRQAKEIELQQRPGLRSPSRIPSLASFLHTYIESRRGELAPGSIELHERTAKYLKGFLGEQRRIDQITRYDAREPARSYAGRARVSCTHVRQPATGFAFSGVFSCTTFRHE
jgi:hypothetical protein